MGAGEPGSFRHVRPATGRFDENVHCPFLGNAVHSGIRRSYHNGVSADSDRGAQMNSIVGCGEFRDLSHVRPTARWLYEDISGASLRVHGLGADYHRIAVDGHRIAEVV